MKLLYTILILTIFSVFVFTISASAFAVPKGQYKITCYKDNQGWIQQATQQICIQSDGGLSGAWYSSTFQNWRGEWFRKGWSNRVRLWGNYGNGDGNDSMEVEFVNKQTLTGYWTEWRDSTGLVNWCATKLEFMKTNCDAPVFLQESLSENPSLE